MPEGQARHRKIERQRAHFNEISGRYVSARQSDNHRLLKTLIWRYMFNRLRIQESLKTRTLWRVLEPMCGAAESLEYLQENLDSDLEYRGYDYSDEMVAATRRERPDLDIRHADATVWKPDPETFDLIVLIGGLHHVPDHAADVVRTHAAGLKPGGLFVNFEPTHGNSVWGLVRRRIYERNTLFDAETERDFPVAALKKMFEAENLVPVRIRYPGLLAYILFYNPDAFPFLNRGPKIFVKTLFNAERIFYGTALARIFSFATFSVWERVAAPTSEVSKSV